MVRLGRKRQSVGSARWLQGERDLRRTPHGPARFPALEVLAVTPTPREGGCARPRGDVELTQVWLPDARSVETHVVGPLEHVVVVLGKARASPGPVIERVLAAALEEGVLRRHLSTLPGHD